MVQHLHVRGAVFDDDVYMVPDAQEDDSVPVPLVFFGGGCAFDCGGSLLFFGGERFECVDFYYYGAASFERVHQLLGWNPGVQGTQEQNKILCDVGRGDRSLPDFAGSIKVRIVGTLC